MKLFINSADRSSGSTTSFVVPITIPIQDVKTARLEWLSMPNTFYNVRSGINNQLVFTDTGGQHTVTIPPSSYSITSLCTELSSLMNSVGAQTYTATFNSALFAVTISATAAFSIQLASSSCASLLGFASTNTGSAVSFTSSKSVALQIDSVFVRISEFASSLYTTDGGSFTFMVPINVDSGSVIEYSPRHDLVQVSPGKISRLTFDLYLKGNEPANLNNAEWKCLIAFE